MNNAIDEALPSIRDSSTQKDYKNHNDLQIFKYKDTPVRTVLSDNGVLWWVLADVCQALDIGNPSDVRTRLDADEVMTLDLTEGHSGQRGGAQKVNVINEPGLYKVIFRSNKPEAKAFTRWVTHEVLPSIRKTGSYSMPGTDPNPTPTSAECLQAIAELRLLGMADETRICRILRQGGFDVEGAVAQPAQRLGGAIPDADPDPGLADAFLAYVLPRATWGLLPFTFLFPLYERWMARNHPGVALLGRNTFIKRVKLLAGRYGWTHKKGQCRPRKDGRNRMQGSEPLAIEFGLLEWQDPSKLSGSGRHRGIYKLA